MFNMQTYCVCLIFVGTNFCGLNKNEAFCQAQNLWPWYSPLMHLGLISSNGITWNASRDCPLSEHSIPPWDSYGQWLPLRSIATRPWHLTSRFVRYLSSSHTIWMIYQISYSITSLIIWRNYLPIDYWHPFVQNIHCIATHVVKGSQFSPHSSIFHFEFRSQMNPVSSLLFMNKP